MERIPFPKTFCKRHRYNLCTSNHGTTCIMLNPIQCRFVVAMYQRLECATGIVVDHRPKTIGRVSGCGLLIECGASKEADSGVGNFSFAVWVSSGSCPSSNFSKIAEKLFKVFKNFSLKKDFNPDWYQVVVIH